MLCTFSDKLSLLLIVQVVCFERRLLIRLSWVGNYFGEMWNIKGRRLCSYKLCCLNNRSSGLLCISLKYFQNIHLLFLNISFKCFKMYVSGLENRHFLKKQPFLVCTVIWILGFGINITNTILTFASGLPWDRYLNDWGRPIL